MLPISTSAFITCALTGAGDLTGQKHRSPITPKEIADSAIEAATAGAAVVHIHVRDPETGKGSRELAYYRETVERIRDSDTDVVINLTTGMGGEIVLGSAEQPLPFDDAGTDMASATDRLEHIEELRPEICTLDASTMNFAAGGDYIMVNTPGMLRAMAERVQQLGVRPEIEVFDTGDLVLLRDLMKEGLIDSPPLVQLCMGIPYGAPNDALTFAAMLNGLPEDAIFSAFSVGRFQLPYAAMALLHGGNIRVGLEDNLYLSRGVLATNGQLVERAATLMDTLNITRLGPDEVREQLGLVKHG